MAKRKSLYYWDSSVFIAWLTDEKSRERGDLEGARRIIDDVLHDRARLVTSVNTTTEILEAHVGRHAVELLDRALRRRNFARINIDGAISALASELRNYYLKSGSSSPGKTLSTPDAQHLAAAIIHNVDEFHTFDKGNGRKTLGLLPLSGNVGGYALRICKPPPGGQMELGLRY